MNRSNANLGSHRSIKLLPGHWMDSGMIWALAYIGLVLDIGGNGILLISVSRLFSILGLVTGAYRSSRP
mgnify:CR=1 FL=1